MGSWAACALDAYLKLRAKAGLPLPLIWRRGRFRVVFEDGADLEIPGWISRPFGHFHGTHTGEDLMRGTDNHHSETGADWLSPWFGPAVTEPIRLHVAAKRYLCAVEPGYFERLSEASVFTLSVQGGPMSGRASLGALTLRRPGPGANGQRGPPGPQPAIVHSRALKLDSIGQVSGSRGF